MWRAEVNLGLLVDAPCGGRGSSLWAAASAMLVGLWFSRALPSLDIPCCRGAGITDMLRTCLYVSTWDYTHAQDLPLCESLGLHTCLRTHLYVSPWGYRHTQHPSVCEFLGFKFKSSHLQWSVYPLSHLSRSPSLYFSCLFLPTAGIMGVCYIPGLCGSGTQAQGLMPPRPALTHVFSTSFLVLGQLACPHKSLATSSGNTSFKGQWFV